MTTEELNKILAPQCGNCNAFLMNAMGSTQCDLRGTSIHSTQLACSQHRYVSDEIQAIVDNQRRLTQAQSVARQAERKKKQNNAKIKRETFRTYKGVQQC